MPAEKIRKTALIIAITLISAFFLDTGRYLVYPDISRLKKVNPRKTFFMEYREREWKKAGKKMTVKQVWVPLSSVSPYLKKAVIIAEDDRFWSHEGFDSEAIEKAIEVNIKKAGFKKGGSTISQQLAKNLYLTPSKNPVRKIKEAILTWRMERTLSKGRILELYLNVAEWGEGIFGIEAASQNYFQKSAMELGPEEAALLASILPNPRRYSPVSPSRYVEGRSRIIYDIMVKRGIVIPEYDEPLDEGQNPATPPLIPPFIPNEPGTSGGSIHEGGEENITPPPPSGNKPHAGQTI